MTETNFRPIARHLAMITDPETRAKEILIALDSAYDKGKTDYFIGTFTLPSGRKMTIKETKNG